MIRKSQRLDLSRPKLEKQSKSKRKPEEKYEIKLNKNARNIPEDLLPLAPTYPTFYQDRRSPEFIRLMDPSKCQSKDKNHPQNQQLSLKDPMEEPRKHGLWMDNGTSLSDALTEMMKKDYETKYFALGLHKLWQNEPGEVVTQVAIPLSNYCRLNPTHSPPFCSQCTIGNPAQVAPALGGVAQIGGIQPEAAQSAPTQDGGTPLEGASAEAAEAAQADAVQAEADQAKAVQDEVVQAEADQDEAAQGEAAQTGVERGDNPVEENPAPFGTMEYMPEVWRNFKIDLETFLPSTTDSELIQQACNFL